MDNNGNYQNNMQYQNQGNAYNQNVYNQNIYNQNAYYQNQNVNSQVNYNTYNQSNYNVNSYSDNNSLQANSEEEYYSITIKQRILNPSTITSLVAAILLMIGLAVPIMDFSVFHKNIDIQYNFGKVCKNVGILSPLWNGLTAGIVIGIILLIALSFVNIPPLKLIPVVLVVVMLVIALADISNVVKWGNELIEKTIGKGQIKLNNTNIKEGIMSGAYFLGAGIITALVSCFIPGAKARKN